MSRLEIKPLSVRRSLPLFLAIVVCLAVWQVWLSWRLMEQDRNLAAQHSRERLEEIADLSIAQLTAMFGEWELQLRELDTLPPPALLQAKLPRRGTLILLTHGSVVTYPHRSFLFVPEPPVAPTLADVFETAGKLEYRDHNYVRAIEALRPLAEQPATRAEALLRIARIERRLDQPAAALTAYDRLSLEPSISPDGVPYALLALGARCDLLAGVRDSRLGVLATKQLRAALLDGRWLLRRGTFEYYWAQLNGLEHEKVDPPQASVELSLLVSRLHEHWQQALRTDSTLSGREAEQDSSLLIWQATPSRLSGLIAPVGWIDASLKLPANRSDIRWKFSQKGAASGAEPHVLRSLAEVQLAGKLEFFSVSTVSNRTLNRALWSAGVALMLLLVLAGVYAMYRGVTRELRVAQLQTDFVSAVSHEFRSPLTSLRGITELLADGRIADEGRQRQSYVFLERETGRLQRLVEDLLDFGRMESRRKQYSIQPHDVFALVRAAVADFQEEALASGFRVEMKLDRSPATIKADEEALRRVIRNLLENAVKYSPECRTVWVEARVNHLKVVISVQDRGMGIDPREQREIFQKFVRGTAAKKAGIKGTGIGLSMVRQIVSACGGEIRLDSAVGAGSTFTILFPLAEVTQQDGRETRV